MKLGILKAWHPNYEYYIKACEDLGVEYEVIDIMSDSWIDEIKKSECDGFLVRPSYFKQYWKDMYDERMYFIVNHLKKQVYPNFDSCFIYENKNNMAYWLKINGFPHPKTNIFYKKDEAIEFTKNCDYPLVFKTKIGAAGLGVKFINNKRQAKRLIRKMFPFKYSIAAGFLKWYKLKTFPHLRVPLLDDRQYGFVMFQEKLNVKCEWRMLRLGDSFFGHQKLEGKNGKHSGSGLVGWVEPPKELLDLVYDVTEKGNFRSMDLDIFETTDGKYYINELQTMFGSFNNSQMYIDDKPGRFRKIENKWVFEEGFYNTNQSMTARVEDFVKILKENK